MATHITERVEYERGLKDSLKEKETLLQEIHHRVKNYLAVVSGMMELQTYNTENEEAKSVLADNRIRIQTMALIHENLYESKSLSEIEFSPYVKELLEYIEDVNSILDDIELDFKCDTFNLNINQTVPCALIINEIVSNAYKNAFLDQEGVRSTSY